ncbi:hypothetical protein [Xanthomonas graminis]|nr:hypothetical protein [Xanthomonas translucens]UKE65643.1 hypothetical protein KM547_18690 [Xanthomonas translucens pv. phlei]UKE73160.1 hypothetical protein KFS85_19445 [Xanthomonas translucens pv. phleipratensis]
MDDLDDDSLRTLMSRRRRFAQSLSRPDLQAQGFALRGRAEPVARRRD